MGGIGSGQYLRMKKGKLTVEKVFSLNIIDLYKEGALSPETYCLCGQWRRRIYNITTKANNDNLDILFTLKGRQTQQRVHIDWTKCFYGGKRPWFFCPSCNRRVAILYISNRCFACRKCSELTYTSCNETANDRALRKAKKIRKRMGIIQGPIYRILIKPKHIHWTTFYRLRSEAHHLEDIWFESGVNKCKELLDKAQKRLSGNIE